MALIVYTRSAEIASVVSAERVIDLIVVPYETESLVEWRGSMWHEIFSRGAFDGITTDEPVPVNREHNPADLVGGVDRFDPDHHAGLFARTRIAPTPRGDETLTLAGAGLLYASIGYYAWPADVTVNRAAMLRRVQRAGVHHVAMTGSPAYIGARVLAVRTT